MFENSRFITQSDKLHADLRLRYQSMYQSPCSTFYHSSIPLQGTWTSLPAAVYCSSLTTYTALRWHNPSVFLMQIFIPSWSHAAENRSSACWRPCWEGANSIPHYPRKTNSWSCIFQQWHPRRLGCGCCDYLFTSYRLWSGIVTVHILVGVQHSRWTFSI